jgi:hypothetical protein
MNQWYNKRMKELKQCLPKEDRERVTRQMERLTIKHNRQVNHYLHAASRRIIDFLVEQGVGTIIVGLCSSARPAGCFNRTHETKRAVSIKRHAFWNYDYSQKSRQEKKRLRRSNELAFQD